MYLCFVKLKFQLMIFGTSAVCHLYHYNFNVLKNCYQWFKFLTIPLSQCDERKAVLKLKHESKKKKTPSLVLLVNMVIEETWADRGVTLDTSASEAFYIGQVALATQLIKPNYLVQTGLQHHGKHRLKTWTNTFRKWLFVFRCVYCFLRYLVLK